MGAPPTALGAQASSPASRLRDWLRAARLIHPFPTALNVAATGALAVVAAEGLPNGALLARMLAAMACAQAAIGATNDYFDRGLDATAKPWKPVAAGLVPPRAALVLAAALVAAAMVLAATISGWSLMLMAVGTACGLAYDARLKRSVLSAVPFMVAMPVLPLWVWVSLGAWDAALWWLLPLGALVGLALHLANTLPDLRSDAEAGVYGLAHRLGMDGSALAAWASFGSAIALASVAGALAGGDGRLLAASILVAAAALGVSVLVYVRWRTDFALQTGFGALGIGAATVATGWLAAVT